MGLFSKKAKKVAYPSSDKSLVEQSWGDQRAAVRAMATMPCELNDFIAVAREGGFQDHLEKVGIRRTEHGLKRRVVLAVVEPEPDNQYDAGALRVLIDGGTVGYIAMKDQPAVRPLMERAIAEHGVASCHANIEGGWDRGGGDLGSIGVELDLRTDDARAKSRR